MSTVPLHNGSFNSLCKPVLFLLSRRFQLLMSEDKKNKIDKEDLQYIADQRYVIEAQEKKKVKKSAP